MANDEECHRLCVVSTPLAIDEFTTLCELIESKWPGSTMRNGEHGDYEIWVPNARPGRRR